MSAGRRLRGLAGAGVIAAPGACDVFTARIIARAGFPALYLGGNAVGLHMGKPQPLVGLLETATLTAAIAASVDTPLIVDAGAGFGEAAHVFDATRRLEHAGAAALHIDDQPYPKPMSYHRGQGSIVPIAEMARRLDTALRARRDADFMVIARTDSLRVTKSLSETIERCRRYAATGIDAIMILDLSPAQAIEVRAALPDMKLVWIGGVAPPVPNLHEIGAAGFALAVYPFNTVAAIAACVGELWAGLRRTGQVGQPAALLEQMRAETLELVDMQTYWGLEDRCI